MITSDPIITSSSGGTGEPSRVRCYIIAGLVAALIAAALIGGLS